MISVGFTSHNSVVNESILFDACLRLASSDGSSQPNKPASDHSGSVLTEPGEKSLNSGILMSGSAVQNDSLEIPVDSSGTIQSEQSNGTVAPGLVLPPTATTDSVYRTSKDTVKLMTRADSLAARSKDSTARLEQFHYSRKDYPYVQLKPKKRSRFFAYPSSTLETRTIELDSTGNFVVISEKIAGQQSRIILRLPIDEYIRLKLDAQNRTLWEELAYKYELKDNERDLSKLISDITNIDIPLPSAGFLSIFGPQKINLRIGGAVDIQGAWRNETTEGITASYLGNTRNEPDFKQQVQINVDGTIGDKLKISADWNTERTFEYENQLKLKYTGYEDEIVQSVEAGNVSLQTSPLVGGSEALFGVKASFLLGPLSLTTLASQKKGEVKEVSVSGGSTTTEFHLRAYDYSPNHYFVDTIYADTSSQYNIFNNYFSNPTPEINDSYYINEIEVWKTAPPQIKDAEERKAVAYFYLERRNQDDLKYPIGDRGPDRITKPGLVEAGRFIRLTPGVDYEYHPQTGFISLKGTLQASEAIAVAYRVNGLTSSSSSDDITFGEFVNTWQDDTTTLVLKLVRPSNLLPSQAAWKLQLKNIYSLGGQEINPDGFTLDINYMPPGSTPQPQIEGKNGTVKLLSAFGLDNLTSDGSSGSDGRFDFIPGRTINTKTGEIIFPVLQPFGGNFPGSLPDSLRFTNVYDTTLIGARNSSYNDRFEITGKFSAASSSVFSLGFVGIVENSVKVLLGGRELVSGVDYEVDYNIGQVRIKNPAALVPGADLRITYEQNDLFQLASKTLLGARGEIKFSNKTLLGFSALNLNQQTLSDKVRIGEEPLNNSIYGVDFSTAVDMPFLTKGLNKVFSTREMSSLSLRGEFAYINPEPNTKKSTVQSDMNSSIAYIDDFEGAKKINMIGVGYTTWRDLSAPDNMPFIGPDTLNISKMELMKFKGKTYWYNFLRGVNVKDIWKEKSVARGDEQVTVLDFVFDPSRRGSFNYTNITDPSKSWGGMMKLLSSAQSNLLDENIEFIEFWVNLTDGHLAGPDAKLNIDLGQISEDVIPNGELNTEDNNRNDLIDEGEDVGLDRLINTNEDNYSAADQDPSGDNYSFSLGELNFENINGTEGNAQSIDAGKFPDTEDLNRNGNMDNVDSYFRYIVPLDTTSANPYITGGGDTPQRWYQIRIPLKDFQKKIGSPTLALVEYIRVWVGGVNKPVHLRIADFNLVGNQWQKVKKKILSNLSSGDTLFNSDEVLSLSVVNVEDNPYYTSPPGVQRERDRSKPDEKVLRNEQSLSLVINGLEENREVQAIKTIRAIDVFNYKEMKLFVHGSDADQGSRSLSYFDPLTGSNASEVYFRFGADSTNYYEYSQPVRAGWNEISIKFEELTTLKQLRDTASVNGKAFSYPVKGMPGHFYRIRGNPALTGVSFFMVGVKNPNEGELKEPVSGEVWINELRVIGADNHSGWAYSSAATFKVADLMNVSFNMGQTDPYFHRLSDRFGSRNDSRNWGLALDFDLMKLIPFNMPGSNLRINYSRNEQISKPLYVPGSDVKVDVAASQREEQLVKQGYSQSEAKSIVNRFKSEQQTLGSSETWTLSNIKLRFPGRYWLVRDGVNGLTFNFTFNKTHGRNPTMLSNSAWSWNAGANYSVNLNPNYFFYPADIPVLGTILSLFSDYRNAKVYYTPQSITTNFSANRNYSYGLSRTTNSAASVSRDFRTTRDASLQWKLTEGGFLNLTLAYNFSIQSSLTHLLAEKVDGRDIEKREREIWKAIFSGESFGRNYAYVQNFDLRTAPKLPTLWNINKYFTLTAGYSVAYNWQNNFSQIDLGRAAQFSNKINANLQLKLKSLFQPLFEEKKTTEEQESSGSGSGSGRGRDRSQDQRNIRTAPEGNIGQMTDSTGNIARMDSSLTSDSSAVAFKDAKPVRKKTSLKGMFTFFKNTFHYVFINYETIRLTFSQDNSVQKGGLRGEGTGFYNFFGFSRNSDNGPGRLFMLGLSSDVGPRARVAQGLTITDNISQRNSIDFSTNRPLWEGAQIDLKWKIGWNESRSTSNTFDPEGNFRPANNNSTGGITRSFLSVPPVFFFSMLKSSIKRVNELYSPEKDNLNEAFVEGFETFSIFKKLPLLRDYEKFIPRPNWNLTWDGLEKYSIFKSFAQRVSLNHGYSSEYTEGWRMNSDGRKMTQSQKVSYGFQPLVGLNMTFKSLWKGNFSGNIKYSTRSSYDLGATTKKITESFAKDIGVTASYSKQGFEMPLFGISLKNDIEITFAYTYSKSSSIIFDMAQFTEEGIPQDGTVRTTMEPRIKYVISSKVTMALYYKRSSVEPEGAARISPTTTNEYGLDVHISIQ